MISYDQALSARMFAADFGCCVLQILQIAWIEPGQGHHKAGCCVDRISEDTHCKFWVLATRKVSMAIAQPWTVSLQDWTLQGRSLSQAEVLALMRSQRSTALRACLEYYVMDLSSTEPALHSELILLLCDEIESRLPERDPRYVCPIHAAFVSRQLLRRA